MQAELLKSGMEREMQSLEKEKQSLEKDRQAMEKDRLAVERGRLAVEREKLSMERDKQEMERDRTTLEVAHVSIYPSPYTRVHTSESIYPSWVVSAAGPQASRPISESEIS